MANERFTGHRSMSMIALGRKRKSRITLSQSYDHWNYDLPSHAMVAETTTPVPNPIAGNTNERHAVLRSLRDDPLAHLHDRGHIGDAQFEAGRAWQRHYENSGIGGVRAIDFTKEAVDGRRYDDALTDTQRQAVKELARLDRQLGQEGCALVRDVLGKGWTLSRCAESRGMAGQKHDQEYLGRRFRECLDTLAVELGFATRKTH